LRFLLGGVVLVFDACPEAKLILAMFLAEPHPDDNSHNKRNADGEPEHPLIGISVFRSFVLVDVDQNLNDDENNEYAD
jgi:hypothetical protein